MKITNRKLIRELLIFILLILFTFWFIFKDQDINNLFDVIKSVNCKYVILGALLMLCYHLTEAYNLKSLLKSFGEKKISIFKALKFTLIGFFFSSITPAATGGQPIEIYYMSKEKLKTSKCAMSSLMILCGFQISTILLGLIGALTNPYVLSDGLIYFFCVGYILKGLALIIMLTCIFSKRLTDRMLIILTKIMKFLRMKNIDKRINKLEEGLVVYHDCCSYIKTHLFTFFRTIIIGVIQMSFYYSVPFCIYKAFGLNSLSYFQIFSMQAILFIAVSSIPLPGEVGISETVFIRIYEKVFGKALIGGAMLLSRGVTFYLYVIISMFVALLNSFKIKKYTGKDDGIFIGEKTDKEIPILPMK